MTKQLVEHRSSLRPGFYLQLEVPAGVNKIGTLHEIPPLNGLIDSLHSRVHLVENPELC